MLQSDTKTIPKELNGQRFDIAASLMFTQFSRKQIRHIIDAGGTFLNRRKIWMAKYAVKEGDIMEIRWVGEEKTKTKTKSDKPFLSHKSIIFENNNFLVLDKPAGMAVEIQTPTDKGTVQHVLSLVDEELYPLGSLHLVHRIDKETSGVFLLAKNEIYKEKLENIFAKHEVHKVYQALCFNVPKTVKGSINWPIARRPGGDNHYLAVRVPKPNLLARPAHTDYTTLKPLAGGNASHLQCIPKTGRSHQIRVHLASIGCPILGDKKYAGSMSTHQLSLLAQRQMLHASKLSFELDGEKFNFEAEMPGDFRSLLNKLQKENYS